MAGSSVEFDAQVRGFVYQWFVDTGAAPLREEVAHGLGVDVGRVAAAFDRLAAGRALVLQPESGEVLMAEPFSAVPTAFEVACGERRYWGNCIWDALGIPALLGLDAEVRTSCPDCGETLTLTVADGELMPASGVVHFALPVRRWWHDIVFT